ncbi:uncharacterized protein PITG_22855 [Phytophthora infestans T30-4]|uniref:Uncharacterized protein n=1 Tax=Phytophthora infestans (strain T30-4) TaxID=403677 RepID=D0NAZ2_PHYIT|nr:uncharacterized protein PITG_22855 [Phytophthora infestans T30-4]EEY55000.1 conserved hypothetical protein [Phytophthora infestans T30-4]|eukprot:XP_002903945.1 conserved hypothetical protein [Phytophthora infestans T30-4]
MHEQALVALLLLESMTPVVVGGGQSIMLLQDSFNMEMEVIDTYAKPEDREILAKEISLRWAKMLFSSQTFFNSWRRFSSSSAACNSLACVSEACERSSRISRSMAYLLGPGVDKNNINP